VTDFDFGLLAHTATANTLEASEDSAAGLAWIHANDEPRCKSGATDLTSIFHVFSLKWAGNCEIGGQLSHFRTKGLVFYSETTAAGKRREEIFFDKKRFF
jgi:hypothetical protein